MLHSKQRLSRLMTLIIAFFFAIEGGVGITGSREWPVLSDDNNKAFYDVKNKAAASRIKVMYS